MRKSPRARSPLSLSLSFSLPLCASSESSLRPPVNEHSEKVNYKRPSFLSKFAELQVVMWNTNAGLTDRHAYDSRPTSWPFLRRGIVSLCVVLSNALLYGLTQPPPPPFSVQNFWVKNHRQIYLIGNPFIWWSSTVAVLLYLFVRGLFILRAKRGFRDLHHPIVAAYDPIFSFLTLAWFLHYAPFFLMSRQLFLHHYLPALYFSVLILAVTFDLACSRLKTRSRLVLAGVVALAAIATWRHFRPLTYGTPWTKGQCEASKWRSSWDFSWCASFLPSRFPSFSSSSSSSSLSSSSSSSSLTCDWPTSKQRLPR